METTNKYFIEVAKLGEYLEQQMRKAIADAAMGKDELNSAEVIRACARYEAFGAIAKYLNQVPWKTLEER